MNKNRTVILNSDFLFFPVDASHNNSSPESGPNSPLLSCGPGLLDANFAAAALHEVNPKSSKSTKTENVEFHCEFHWTFIRGVLIVYVKLS